MSKITNHNHHQIYSVSSLSRAIQSRLETDFENIWVEGEITNLVEPPSGHAYFSIKEDDDLLRCAFFKYQRIKSHCTLIDSMQALLRAQVSLYRNRGDLQLIVTSLQETGEGALRRAFKRLKKALMQEGLFDARHKKPILRLPETVVVITSAAGAAIHDIRSTLARRSSYVRMLLYPTEVQGVAAVTNIVNQLKLANKRRDGEVIILARGGGSLEDLHAFNDEKVVRAVFDSEIPVISGVGHESDLTLVDLVADHRASTPTAAAEAACLHSDEIYLEFNLLVYRAYTSIRSQLRDQHQKLDYLLYAIGSPEACIRSLRNSLQNLSHMLTVNCSQYMNAKRLRLISTSSQLRQHSPLIRVQRQRQRLQKYHGSLTVLINATLVQLQRIFVTQDAKLSVISPYRTLERGYAILETGDKIIATVKSVSQGDMVEAILHDGRLQLRVEPGNSRRVRKNRRGLPDKTPPESESV